MLAVTTMGLAGCVRTSYLGGTQHRVQVYTNPVISCTGETGNPTGCTRRDGGTNLRLTEVTLTDGRGHTATATADLDTLKTVGGDRLCRWTGYKQLCATGVAYTLAVPFGTYEPCGTISATVKYMDIYRALYVVEHRNGDPMLRSSNTMGESRPLPAC